MTGSQTRSPISIDCARATHLMRRRGERDAHARARLGLSFRRTLMIGRGMSGIKGFVSSRISNSLTTHGTWLSRPGLGRKAAKPRGASLPLGQSTPHKELLLLRRETLCFLLYYSPSRLSCIFFILVGWSFNTSVNIISCIPTFLVVKYPVYSRRALRICLLFLLWAWGCASIVNHGLVPGTDAMDT